MPAEKGNKPQKEHEKLQVMERSTASGQNYDFTSPITTIEQRRIYRKEFESEYDEYSKLLKRLKEKKQHIRLLRMRLQNAYEGYDDFQATKKEISDECQRFRNDQDLRRDKERFDYLYTKLGLIRKLILDFDKIE